MNKLYRLIGWTIVCCLLLLSVVTMMSTESEIEAQQIDKNGASSTDDGNVFVHPEYPYRLILPFHWKITTSTDVQKPGFARIDVPSLANERLEFMVVPNKWGVTALEWVEYLGNMMPYSTEILERDLTIDGAPTIVQRWSTQEPSATGVTYVIDAGDYFLLFIVEPDTLYTSSEVSQILSHLSVQDLKNQRLPTSERVQHGLLVGSSPASPANTDWKLPWENGTEYYFTGGPHYWRGCPTCPRNGLDFDNPPGGSTAILTIADARITYVGSDTTGFGNVVVNYRPMCATHSRVM